MYALVNLNSTSRALCIAVVLVGGQFTFAAAPPAESSADFASCLRTKDWRGVEAALQALWESDPEAALRLAGGMLTPSGPASSVAVSAIGDHATLPQLLSIIGGLKPANSRDERRWLVRCLGRFGDEAAVKCLAALLTDQDRLVAAAAAQALAQAGDPRGLAALASAMPRIAPADQSKWEDSGKASVEMSASGAARILSAERAPTIDQVLVAGRQSQSNDRPHPREEVSKAIPIKVRGQVAYPAPLFDIYFRSEDLTRPADRGAFSWPELMAGLDRTTNSAQKAAEPVFGLVQLPVLRLYLADSKQFSSLAGTPTSFSGVTKGNEIVLRLGTGAQTFGTLHHEYIHALQQASFPEQPRWMSEGIAESLSVSLKQSVWTPKRVTAMGLEEWCKKGAVSEAVRWKAGAVSGDREAKLYALSHLVVDYLRFGPHGAANARLAFTMGRLSRGEPASRALESVYGMDIKELDAGLAAWLAAKN